MVTELALRDFDRVVLKSDIPVFVCFSTSPCGSCVALCIVVADLAEEYSERVKFVKIDVGTEPELVDRYNIRALPAVLLFHHGRPVEGMVGFRSKANMRKALDTLVARNEYSL